MNKDELKDLLKNAQELLEFYQKPTVHDFEETIGYYKGVIATIKMILEEE